MQVVQVQIGELFPCVLGCLSDGTVALLKPHNIPTSTVFDEHPVGSGFVDGTFQNSEFHLFREGFETTLNYNTAYRYKEIPLLLAWLRQQNLLMPTL